LVQAIFKPNLLPYNTPHFFKIVRDLSWLTYFFLVKMEQSVPKRRRIKFRRWGITQKKAYNIFWLLHKNTPFVSFKAVFSVDIPLLKPYCCETSKLLNATRWRKLLHISLSNASEKHHVIVREFYDLSY